MDLYDVGSYDMQTLLKLPPLQPSIELRRQQCASAAERRAPVPSAHDRASRMLDQVSGWEHQMRSFPTNSRKVIYL